MLIDDKDIRILDLLQEDARLPQAEIGRRVGLSAAAVNERMRKLEHRGFIVGYAAVVDPERIGCDITAFVEVFIEHPRFESQFVARMKEIPEIQEVHHVTGEFSCLLKLKVWDRRALQRLLLDEINSLPGVRQTRTLIALSTSKEDFRIPLTSSQPVNPTKPAPRRIARAVSVSAGPPAATRRSDRPTAKEHTP